MAASEGRPRVLVVDDEPSAASLVADVLDENGFSTAVCGRGAEAIERQGRQPCDLVVLDVRLPDISGIEVARRMKAAVAEDDFLPIIMLSALGSESDRLAGLEIADDYIVKPFSAVELVARVKAFLRIRRMHRDLAQSRRLYRDLHDSAPFMHVTLDPGHAVVWCNRAFTQAAGCTAGEARGRAFDGFFVESDRPAVRDLLEAVASGAGAGEARFSLDAHGGALPVDLRAVRTGARDPEDPPLVVVMQDVGRRVRMEEEQKTARQQLYRSARLTSLGMLASGVAHELNNPLTAVLGFSSALLERVKQDGTVPQEDLREYLEVIYNETMRCRDVIDALSSFAVEREARVTNVSLLDSVNTAVRLLQPRAHARGLTIENRIGHDVWVRADGSRLGQVFVNVLNNAIDFCRGAGTVALEAELEPPGNPGFVVVRISDNGPGIAAEDLPRVFDPFFTTKEVGKGTGLGLTMCHTIMKESGGAIDIVSEPGKGTTVVLDIPRAGDGR